MTSYITPLNLCYITPLKGEVHPIILNVVMCFTYTSFYLQKTTYII